MNITLANYKKDFQVAFKYLNYSKRAVVIYYCIFHACKQ